MLTSAIMSKDDVGTIKRTSDHMENIIDIRLAPLLTSIEYYVTYHNFLVG